MWWKSVERCKDWRSLTPLLKVWQFKDVHHGRSPTRFSIYWSEMGRERQNDPLVRRSWFTARTLAAPATSFNITFNDFAFHNFAITNTTIHLVNNYKNVMIIIYHLFETSTQPKLTLKRYEWMMSVVWVRSLVKSCCLLRLTDSLSS